jgi:hypothetical protein
MVSIPTGVSNTSQQGGGSIPAGHFFSLPMIHPRLCNTMKSGELKSLLEIMPVLTQNNCGALNASEARIKSAASRRVRKSRGEQPRVIRTRHTRIGHTTIGHTETARIDVLAVRMMSIMVARGF